MLTVDFCYPQLFFSHDFTTDGTLSQVKVGIALLLLGTLMLEVSDFCFLLSLLPSKV